MHNLFITILISSSLFFSFTKPDSGAIINSYSGWAATVTDENSHTKTFTKDAYGRLVTVVENNLGVNYTTSYKYNALDNLTEITDHAGNKFVFGYDTLGRRVSMTDPDLGAWSYGYDNNGNLTQSINANSQTIIYGYDELNRLKTKDYTHASGIEVTYNYDESASTNPIGRRTSMQDLSGKSRWDYDLEGRIVRVEKTIDKDTYITEWVYDAMDRVKSIILPNKKQLSFRYNNAGLPEGVDGYINSSEYNAASQPTAILFANPVTQRFDYYPENNRLKNITAGSLQDLRYTYDSVGNVTQIVDAVHSYTKGYTYDGLDRLLTGDIYSYLYNPIGNLTTANGITQGYTSKVHALTNDGVNSYSYDSCGNMTAGAGRSITYDAENRPLKITKGSATTVFTYDGDGKRAKKTATKGSTTSTTIYIEGLYEKETNPEKSPAFKHKFTGKELDEETGLYDYGARMYDAKIGRFISPDPIDFSDTGIRAAGGSSLQAFLANPQNLNRYTYCLNNPLRYIDPTGRYVESPADWLSLSMSFDEFQRNPGILSGAAVALDIIGLASPGSTFAGFTLKGMGGAKAFMSKLERLAAQFKKVDIITGHNKSLRGAVEIEGFTKHAVDQAIQRGVKPKTILDAIRNPLKIKEVVYDKLGRASQRIIGRGAEIVINPDTKKIISVNPTSTRKAMRLLKLKGE